MALLLAMSLLPAMPATASGTGAASVGGGGDARVHPEAPAGEEEAPRADRGVAESDWDPPRPSRSTVEVSDGSKEEVEGSPITVEGHDGDRARPIEVEVYDQATAERLGASGFVFRLADTSPPGDAGEAGATDAEPEAGSTAPQPDAEEDPESTSTTATTMAGEDVAADTADDDGARVEEPAGKPPTTKDSPVSVEVDYSSIAGRYGGFFAARLQLRLLPGCALQEPLPKGCDVEGVLVEAVNDFTNQVLTFEIDPAGIDERSEDTAEPLEPSQPALDESPETTTTVSPSEESTTTTEPVAAQAAGGATLAQFGGSGGGSVLMLSGGSSGPAGSYAATPLKMSSSWQVGPGSGAFSWSYPIEGQPAPGGATPPLSLDYSSASVDGMVGGENNQASQLGSGWSVTEAYIERRYASCSFEGVSGAQDLCWGTDNAVLHLNGVTTELVKDGTEWKAKDDPNWRITRGTGATNGDNDGEYWRVRTPDGTVYDFGRGTLVSTEGSDATDSVWTVPVWGDDSGDPCHASPGYCTQGWRWNLDRVVDLNENMTVYSYVKETNKFKLRVVNSDVSYTRGGYLSKIEYGRRAANPTSSYLTNRIRFDVEYRCNTLTSSCPAPTKTNGTSFPDVPNDLICSSACTKSYPSFFSGVRYTQVTTMTYDGGGMRDVDRIRLVHDFVHNGEDQDADGSYDTVLWLRHIDKQGHYNGANRDVPAIHFSGCGADQCALLVNRADANPSGGALELKQWRIAKVTTDSGAQIDVTYGQPHPCPNPGSVAWDNNTTNCFPQSWDPPDSPPGNAVFNKWLATQVRVQDLVGSSPDQISTYTYLGTPGTRLRVNPFGADYRNDARGYEKTRVTTGSGTTKTRTLYQVFRGLHGDPNTNGTTDSVSITAGDGTTYTDSNWLAGRTLEVSLLANDAVTMRRATKYTYTSVITGTDGSTSARWIGESGRKERFNEGGTADKVTTTYYNANRLPELVNEAGWSGTSGDERCTNTAYTVADTTNWILAFPARVTTRAGLACDTDTGTIVDDERTYYDGLGLAVSPDDGNPTKTTRWNGTSWMTTWEGTYDYRGRPTSTKIGPNPASTIDYSPDEPTGTNGITVITTNPKGHVSQVRMHDQRTSLPKWTQDANGGQTLLDYDALGRLENVWLPTEYGTQTEANASAHFDYSLVEHAQGYGVASAPWTGTRTLLAAGSPNRYSYEYTVFDGQLRQRQTATVGRDETDPNAPVNGYVISQTRYDSRGLVVAALGPQNTTTSPTTIQSHTWANYTDLVTDDLGRVTSSTVFASTGANHVTTTSYTYNSTRVNPPVGGDKRTTTDAYGRTSRVETLLAGVFWIGASYAHDAAGRLTSITDADAHQITYTYDAAGRRTDMVDPDAGDWHYTYDTAGNQITSQDALDAVVWTKYDELNRPLERRTNGSTGTLLAQWSYDGATNGVGLPHTATRLDASSQSLTSTVGAYDARGRPLQRTWAIPASYGFNGANPFTFTATYGYSAGRQTSVSYPAVGGLAAETVTTAYHDDTGTPTRLSGLADYVDATKLGPLNRVRQRTLGTGTNAVVRDYGFDSYQRLIEWKATRGGTVIQQDRLALDDVGNVIRRKEDIADQWECYAYNDFNQLTSAFTTTSLTGTTCNPHDGLGNAPYNHTYAYHADGRLNTRNLGTGTQTYTYGTKPHAVTDITGTASTCNGNTDAYCYDANGNMTSRPGTGNQTITWDTEHRVSTVADTAGTTSMVYDPDGQRLIRTTPSDSTLYIEGHEITKTGSSITTKRYYSMGSTVVAVRDTATTQLTYLLGDQLGSTTVSVNSAGGTPVVQRYLPYGALRSTTGGSAVTDKGWIGQTKDNSTGLQYLNARYYDPTIGRFTAADPLADLNRPATLDAYGYSSGSPVTLSDPSGLLNELGGGGSSPSRTRANQSGQCGMTLNCSEHEIKQLTARQRLRTLEVFAESYGLDEQSGRDWFDAISAVTDVWADEGAFDYEWVGTVNASIVHSILSGMRMFNDPNFTSPNEAAQAWVAFFQLDDSGEDDLGEMIAHWATAETQATGRGVDLANASGDAKPAWADGFLRLSQMYRDAMGVAGAAGRNAPLNSAAEQTAEAVIRDSALDPRNYDDIHYYTEVALAAAKDAAGVDDRAS